MIGRSIAVPRTANQRSSLTGSATKCKKWAGVLQLILRLETLKQFIYKNARNFWNTRRGAAEAGQLWERGKAAADDGGREAEKLWIFLWWTRISESGGAHLGERPLKGGPNQHWSPVPVRRSSQIQPERYSLQLAWHCICVLKVLKTEGLHEVIWKSLPKTK